LRQDLSAGVRLLLTRIDRALGYGHGRNGGIRRFNTAQRASTMSAQGNALGRQSTHDEAPKWAALIPDIAFVQFYVVAFAEGPKFVLEGYLLMMFFLAGDVFLHLLDI
jgi:hypothetical protein